MTGNARIHANVRLGQNVTIGDFVIIGVPPAGAAEGALETIIGDNAVIRSHTVIYAGTSIGRDLQTGHHVLIRENSRIGDNVSIGSSSIIEHDVTIHNGVRLHSRVFVPEFTILEDLAWIGPNVVMTNARYPRSPQVKEHLKGPHIMKNAKVGANSTLLPGVVLHEHCLVGAGSVVTRDVPQGKVVAGNPARVINDIAELPYDPSGNDD